MKFEEVAEHLEGIPCLPKSHGRFIYEYILKRKIKSCLELGFYHGVSTCYIAAALQELGRGKIITVDLQSSYKNSPNLEQLLEKTGLSSYVQIFREKDCYTWFLKNLIEQNLSQNNGRPIIDFCFIDGPKLWKTDGFAFFLVDKLMKRGGSILFDDLTWSYGAHARGRDMGQKNFSADQIQHPNIESVFRLLVYTHPEYNEFEILYDNFALCRKIHKEKKDITYISSEAVKNFHKSINFPQNQITISPEPL